MSADAGPVDPARTVGFVGIGNMGWPMAANLVRAGFQVAVADAASGRAARFAAEVGGRACDGAASVAAAPTCWSPACRPARTSARWWNRRKAP